MRTTRARGRESGVTLMELLSAMNKTDTRLMSNRRVTSVQRILEQEIEGLMPVTADCQPGGPEGPVRSISFFQGELQSMRFASTYSLQQGSRGQPMILEFLVIPGEDSEGVRLIVNEHLYTGPRGAGRTCSGFGPDAEGVQGPTFFPIQIGEGSFVLADKLAFCRFSYRDTAPPPDLFRWIIHWTKPILPIAIRIEMAPLKPDPARLEPVTLTVPVRVNRHPTENYEF
jgi:hypothetical protein